uniref:ATPase 10 plasma membrane-type-like n=1 Tax=Rhizophora mucronata TaxID=61149 RepID=A0A2P2MS47_RHIMU
MQAGMSVSTLTRNTKARYERKLMVYCKLAKRLKSSYCPIHYVLCMVVGISLKSYMDPDVFYLKVGWWPYGLFKQVHTTIPFVCSGHAMLVDPKVHIYDLNY